MPKDQSIPNIDKKAKIFTGKKLYIMGSIGFLLGCGAFLLTSNPQFLVRISFPDIFSVQWKISEGFKSTYRSLAGKIVQNMDITQLKTLNDSKDEGSSNYMKLQSILQTYKRDNEKIAYLYVFKQINGRCIYVLDAEPVSEPDHVSIGDKFSIEDFPKAREGFNHSVFEVPIFDAEIQTLSTTLYTPIKDGNNVTVAVLGMDIIIDSDMAKKRLLNQ